MGQYQETTEGTPQGGVISPLLANIALDGLERLFECERPDRSTISPSKRTGRNRGVGLVRYADDFVVTAPSQEVLNEYVRPKSEQFLAERGLTLNEAKTRIVQIDEGFNFLGFTIQRVRGRILTRPQKEKVQTHIRRLKAIVIANRHATQGTLIKRLNPVIKGWANYYRYGASSRTYRLVSYHLWRMLWQWARYRHPHKGARWRAQRYWKQEGNRRWAFGTLCRPEDTPIARWDKVRGNGSPYEPGQSHYWEERNRRVLAEQTDSGEKRLVLSRQGYRCGQCNVAFQPKDDIDLHHRIPLAHGGPDTTGNLVALHKHCHHQWHKRHGTKVLKA